jgi:hypothetical protein
MENKNLLSDKMGIFLNNLILHKMVLKLTFVVVCKNIPRDNYQ